MREPRVLLVDDEPSIQRALAPLLRSRGYDVEVVGRGSDAIRAVDERCPDVMVLDLGLPDVEGPEVCRQVRQKSGLPILILSARGGEADKVSALDLGADDYITKPFSPEELLARIRVALRRVFSADEGDVGQVRTGRIVIDYDRRRIVKDDDEIRLTPKEFELLSLLARNADRVMTHRAILRTVWGAHAVDHPEHLWVLMGQLRRKIEDDPARPKYLVSEPWVGYRFVSDPL